MQYLFFDTAVNGYYTLLTLKKECQNWVPLLSKEENISDDAAPFLFEIDDERLKQFLSTEHISFKEILFIESDEAITTVRDYFRQFVVQTIDGQEFYFRFWAANVFKKYITGCNAKQLTEFFKIVEKFWCEHEESGSFIRFSFDGKKLASERIADPNLFSGFGIVSSGETSSLAPGNDKSESNSTPKKKPVRKFFSE